MHFDASFDELAFGGIARLFPLPELVVFPHVVQALHIFEPRYRVMLADALAGDQLLALATLSANGPEPSSGLPRIAPLVCLTRIVTAKRLPDGCSNVLVVGLRRARIVAEEEVQKPYREVRLELLPETRSATSDPQIEELRKSLTQKAKQFLESTTPGTSLNEVLDKSLDLCVLTDVLSYAIPLEVNLKLELLGESDVYRRALKLNATLDCYLGSLSSSRHENPFPPRFSEN